MRTRWIFAGVGGVFLVGTAFLVFYLNSPNKRYSKHINKARIFARQDNYVAAHNEYKNAYEAKGGYTPYVSEEVFKFESKKLMRDGKIQAAAHHIRAFLKHHPEHVGASLMLARISFDLHDHSTAFSVLNDLIRKNPASVEARNALAEVRASQGRLDLAEQQYRVLVRSHPGTVQPMLLLADNLSLQNKTKESRELLRQALAKDPLSSAIHLKLVDTWLMDRKLDSARAALDDWGQLDTTLNMEVAVRKARIYGLTRRFDSAHAALAPYLEKHPKNVTAIKENALLLVKQNMYDKAIRTYRDLRDMDPMLRYLSMSLQGLLHLANQNPAQALESIKQFDPSLESPDNVRYAVFAYMAMDQRARAREMLADPRLDKDFKASLEEFIAKAVPDKRFMAGLGLINYFILTQQGSYVLETTIQLYTHYRSNPIVAALLSQQYSLVNRPDLAFQVLARIPDPTLDQKVQMAKILLAAKQGGKAASILSKVLEQDSTLRGINPMLADYYQSKGNTEKAIRFYHRELRIDPGDLISLNNLAWHYGVVKRDMGQAGEYIQAMRKTGAWDPRILDTIGWIYALNGNPQQAESYLSQALNLIPDDPSFLYHLSFVKNLQGRREEAKRFLEQALENPGPWDGKADAEKLYRTIG